MKQGYACESIMTLADIVVRSSLTSASFYMSDVLEGSWSREYLLQVLLHRHIPASQAETT